MSSRKDEERTEKIIRGLMKLPPNRRCINCNSLGPQYVCTNFWTFVCMTCSGIHREFTHRVKSVSMAKFTSQEVEALQMGGNQRAREMYLKDWDSQRLRLPDNSNADKIREFIKNVYVDKKFSGGKSSERPPRDSQKLNSHEEETRRASSYHSFSQSPPYDFQYEERRYGRHAPVLSRKPGSDRGLYDGKFSSFLSPNRLSDRSSSHSSDHMYEDGFANERSSSRVSDYSGSNGGDLFRSGIQSPNFQKDIGSPSSETSRDSSGDVVMNYTGSAYSDSYARRDAVTMPCPQGTASSGSFGSFDNNSLSFKSITGSVNITREAEQSAEAHCNKSSLSGNSDSIDLFSLPFAPKDVTSTVSAKDISNLPGNSGGVASLNAPFVSQNATFTASTANMSCAPELSSAKSLDIFESHVSKNSYQLPQTLPPSSISLSSENPQQQPSVTFSEKPSDMLVPQNEGWATFDVPDQSVPVIAQNSASAKIPSSSDNAMMDPLVSLDLWPSFHDTTAQVPVAIQTAGNEAPECGKARTNTSWNAFEDFSEQQPFGNVLRSSNQDALHHSSTSDQFLSLNELNKDQSQSVAMDDLHSLPSVSSCISTTQDDSSMLPAPGIHSYPVDVKSVNPFELPCDDEIEYGITSQFWDMNSLQAALPNVPIPTSFTSDTDQPWFHQDPLGPYSSEGALGFMTAQASNTHISTVQSPGPVSSIGGNPFAW